MTVNVTDVAVELGRPTPSEPQESQWDAWINRAYRLIASRLGAVAYAALDPMLLDDVVLAAVAEHVRAWRDTTASRYTVSVDDGSVSRSYESSVGYFSIPDDLWDLLNIPVAGRSFTIGPL